MRGKGGTLFFSYKNHVYKNVEAQIALEFKNVLIRKQVRDKDGKIADKKISPIEYLNLKTQISQPKKNSNKKTT